MLRLRRVPATRYHSLFLVMLLIVGCTSVSPTSNGLLARYAADDINVEENTIGGKKISSFADVQLEVTGLAKSWPNGRSILYLSRDQGQVETKPYRNCINLIMDKKLKFDAAVVGEYTFSGKLVLIARVDPTVVYLTYKNIRFDTDCQSFQKSDQYPYFVVEGFRKSDP